jgi:hypothetical protein
MDNDSFTALCELEFVETTTGQKVIVRLGAPAFDSTRNWYCCLTEISGLDEGKCAPVYGVNPFQAISMSMKRFRTAFEKQSGSFATLDGSAPHTVFPREIPWTYGSDIYQRLCNMVEAEIQKIEHEQTRRFDSKDQNDKN